MPRGKGKNALSSHQKKRHIEPYEHKGKKRINNPPVGLVTPETDPPLPTHKTYEYPRQVFFPMADDDEGWARLARNLKAEIDLELIEKYRGTVSLPFEPGPHKRIAVKVVDDRGIESLKVLDL